MAMVCKKPVISRGKDLMGSGLESIRELSFLAGQF
jgi:hypothetical protein